MTSTSVEYNSQLENEEGSDENVWSSCNFEIGGLQNKANPPQTHTHVTENLEEPWWSTIPPVTTQFNPLYPPPIHPTPRRLITSTGLSKQPAL